jgi:hypothetical protein
MPVPDTFWYGLFLTMKGWVRIFVLAVCISNGALFAQVGSLRVLSGSVCSGVVETPVLASQLNGMAAMSVRILFDSTAISYQGVRNVHPAIANAIISGANSRFVIAWFSLQAVNIANDTLLVIRWANNGGRVSALQFDTQTLGGCEIANVQGQVLPVQYISGQASITGAQAPLPLNPLQLVNLNQPNYLFVFSRPMCLQQAVLQLAADSQFNQLTFTQSLSDTFYRYSFSGIAPAQGDSVRWWRLGGVYGADTAWSARGRMSFALSLGLNEALRTRAKVFPNPFESHFRMEHPSWKEADWMLLRLYKMDGTLLEQKQLKVADGGVDVEIKNTEYHGQMLLFWQNSGGNGLVLANKVRY